MDDAETDPFMASFTCDDDGEWWFTPPVGETRLKVDGEEVWRAAERYRWGSRFIYAMSVVVLTCIWWFSANLIALGWPKWGPFALGGRTDARDRDDPGVGRQRLRTRPHPNEVARAGDATARAARDLRGGSDS